jgi:carbamate kinase
VLATDVAGVLEGWGTPDERLVAGATPAWLRARPFAAGSMGPKVEAACRVGEATGGRAAIGELGALAALVAGTGGTQVTPDPS